MNLPSSYFGEEWTSAFGSYQQDINDAQCTIGRYQAELQYWTGQDDQKYN